MKKLIKWLLNLWRRWRRDVHTRNGKLLVVDAKNATAAYKIDGDINKRLVWTYADLATSVHNAEKAKQSFYVDTKYKDGKYWLLVTSQKWKRINFADVHISAAITQLTQQLLLDNEMIIYFSPETAELCGVAVLTEKPWANESDVFAFASVVWEIGINKFIELLLKEN